MPHTEFQIEKERMRKHFAQHQKEIVSSWKEGGADWRDVAALILEWEVAQPATLGEFPPGMNKWLKDFAKELGLQVSNLWRYRKAVISARGIWNTGEHPVKDASDIPEHIGPESIELVEKISRAAPSEVISDVARRLYDNKITRSELRKIWQSIRHVVKDESRNIPVYGELPKIDERRRGALFEELCYEAIRKDLLENEESVLGGKGQCFRDPSINRLIVDIVAVTRDEDGCALYHAIEVKESQMHRQSLERMTSVLQYFDYLWIAVPAGSAHYEHVPEQIGILEYTEGKLIMVRMAKRNPEPDMEFVSRHLIPILIWK